MAIALHAGDAVVGRQPLVEEREVGVDDVARGQIALQHLGEIELRFARAAASVRASSR